MKNVTFLFVYLFYKAGGGVMLETYYVHCPNVVRDRLIMLVFYDLFPALYMLLYTAVFLLQSALENKGKYCP